jgi:hypothetical protein
VQTFVPEQQINQMANQQWFSQRMIQAWGGFCTQKIGWKVLMDRTPKNLSEEFDPGSE